MANASTNTAPVTASGGVPPAFLTRDELLAWLGPEDAALVAAAVAQASVDSGEEYIDLHYLDHGVRRANGRAGTISNVLPKGAVSEQLWLRILTRIPGDKGASVATAPNDR